MPPLFFFYRNGRNENVFTQTQHRISFFGSLFA